MQALNCGRCGATVFFENRHCGQCGAILGFLPGPRRMGAFDTGWAGHGELAGQRFSPCANRQPHDVCNWMLDEGDTAMLCRSCRLTTLIPALSEPGNLERWRRVEQAKRRLVEALIGLGLAPSPNKARAIHAAWPSTCWPTSRAGRR